MTVLVRFSYAVVAFVLGTLLVATVCGVIQLVVHNTSGNFGLVGRTLIVVGGAAAAVTAFVVSGWVLEGRPSPPAPTTIRAALRRVVIVMAAVPDLAVFAFGDWAQYLAVIALIVVAIPFAAVYRSGFQDLTRAAGTLLVMIGFAYFGAGGLGIFPLASGLLLLLAGSIRGTPRDASGRERSNRVGADAVSGRVDRRGIAAGE